MSYKLEIQSIEDVTHDVKRIRLAKPDGYQFTPGQATEVALDREGWRDEKRPFTFTSLNSDPWLEFTIKVYPEHDGVTLLGDKFINVVTREKPAGDSLFLDGHIDENFLASHISGKGDAFYVCGPEAFNDDIIDALKALGIEADSLVFEE
ncbi:hypothetical protein CWE21_01525 [Pseudidiomarina aquimaris]|uniref:FAD-binding FR-type domain-containing protein n=1 Tax=Pseudidiomarina aquimaris TaxID=641841 RepID=A0A432XQ42_9GAMM|nr:hypothetical protein [Pseudidiomarina aquimaris]RUO50802.1 hypothetical protein CWE21_01525 [Pseudidiomarina aquimaris]